VDVHTGEDGEGHLGAVAPGPRVSIAKEDTWVGAGASGRPRSAGARASVKVSPRRSMGEVALVRFYSRYLMIIHLNSTIRMYVYVGIYAYISIGKHKLEYMNMHTHLCAGKLPQRVFSSDAATQGAQHEEQPRGDYLHTEEPFVR
jgi:hypothetical protein